MNRWCGLKGVVFLMLLIFSVVPLSGQSPTPDATNGRETNAPYLGSFYGDSAPGERKPEPKTSNPFLTMLQIILYVGILGGGGYFLVRFIIKKGSLPSTENIEMVELLLTKQMGMGAFLQVAKVGKVYYLLSLSGEGLRLIDRITDQETIDWLELHKDQIKPKTVRFLDILSHLPVAKGLNRFDFLKNQKDRLKKL